MTLYPMKFQPIHKPKIWGSESWELSGYGDDISVVSNGFLKGTGLNELVQMYRGNLVGEKVYTQYGNLFPLLFKIINAQDDLSIQVHPSDEAAASQGQLGKTEMWYVMDAEENASIVLGFAKNTSRQEFVQRLEQCDLPALLQTVNVTRGDVAYIPAGKVHALKRGTMVAEVQETSDLTYRIYDYNRVDKQGNKRELHIEQALDVMDYQRSKKTLVTYRPEVNKPVNLVTDLHFTTNLIYISETIERDYSAMDSFVAYMCVSGQVLVEGNTSVWINKGETILVPAMLKNVRLTPIGSARLLEVYIAE